MIWLFLSILFHTWSEAEANDICLDAYKDILVSFHAPDDEVKISTALQEKLIETWQQARAKMIPFFQAKSATMIPSYDPELLKILENLQADRRSRSVRVVELREKRRALKEEIEGADILDRQDLQAEKLSLDLQVNRLMREVDSISSILLPIREWVGLSIFQNVTSQVANSNHALILLRNVDSTAAGQLIKSGVGKQMQFKFQSSELGVISGLIPRDQSLSKAAALTATELAKKQAEVEKAIADNLVEAHPFRIGTFVALQRGGSVVFVDKALETIDSKDIVQVLSMKSDHRGAAMIASDIDPFAFAFKEATPPPTFSPQWGIRNDLEQELIDAINKEMDLRLGSEKGTYMTHGPENRNPNSSGISGYPISAYFPDGSVQFIPQGPSEDPDRFIRQFFRDARKKGFNLEENPLWGWPAN